MQQVPQLCAVWCAKASRPFSALGEQTHQGILHPTVVQHLPTQKAVSNNIGQLYTAVQYSIIKSLKAHTGAIYLVLDVWQSPNGYNPLGTVIYRMVEDKADGFYLKAMPLDFVRLKKSHTGFYLAEKVQLIVDKFGLRDKVQCGVSLLC
ncbi:hypothetical protein PTTG_10316 [Puccinia triticina 1-1 BBBD Race 1]|uniref:Uncharacterized protein n=1 Tax=Puccinia triticina (isolate 1-1 / race 1 (BBBD)) TaxID=630390 RepID=A0A0C4FAS3_PUCT1|nr:hypothetical protein PTTG_10316 [Puccinia triticina 1-1 BBBD Race 1]